MAVHVTQIMLDLCRADGTAQKMPDYLRREKGYDIGSIQAWKLLREVKDRSLLTPVESLTLLDRIHESAMSHIPQFMTDTNGMKWLKGRAQVPTYCGLGKSPVSNEQGILELIQKIWVEKNEIQLIAEDHAKRRHILTREEYFVLGEAMARSSIFKNKDDSRQLTLPVISNTFVDLYKKSTFSDGYCGITILNLMKPKEREERALDLLNDYFDQIQKAGTDREKIRAVATLIRELLQLHLYIDGNSRTLYIMANILLHQKGLPLFYPQNLSIFDANSIDTMIEEVELGQRRFDTMFGDVEQLIDGLTRYEVAVKAVTAVANDTFKNDKTIQSLIEVRDFAQLSNHSASNEKYSQIVQILKQYQDDLNFA